MSSRGGTKADLWRVIERQREELAALRAASPAAVPPAEPSADARSAELARLARELADADLGPVIRAQAITHAVEGLTDEQARAVFYECSQVWEDEPDSLANTLRAALLRALAGETP